MFLLLYSSWRLSGSHNSVQVYWKNTYLVQDEDFITLPPVLFPILSILIKRFLKLTWRRKLTHDLISILSKSTKAHSNQGDIHIWFEIILSICSKTLHYTYPLHAEITLLTSCISTMSSYLIRATGRDKFSKSVLLSEGGD